MDEWTFKEINKIHDFLIDLDKRLSVVEDKKMEKQDPKPEKEEPKKEPEKKAKVRGVKQ